MNTTDQLCLDQHEMAETAHNEQDHVYSRIVHQLQSSITVPGSVLMILHPFSQPIVLSRAW